MKSTIGLGLIFGFLSLATHANNNFPIFIKVPLTCENPGTHQDVSKTPIITNTTGKYIGADVKVYWKATDGDKGYVQGPFAINEKKLASGRAGNGYQCEAYYLTWRH